MKPYRDRKALSWCWRVKWRRTSEAPSSNTPWMSNLAIFASFSISAVRWESKLRLSSSLKLLYSFFTQLFHCVCVCVCVCVQQTETLWLPFMRQCLEVCAVIPIFGWLLHLAPLRDKWLSTHPSEQLQIGLCRLLICWSSVGAPTGLILCWPTEWALLMPGVTTSGEN